MATFINLTPHDVVVYPLATFDEAAKCYRADNSSLILPTAGLARCAVEDVLVDVIAGIPIYETSFGAVEGLPDPQPGTFYIGSGLVQDAEPGRTDILSPHHLVRDVTGRVIGCSAFRRPRRK